MNVVIHDGDTARTEAGAAYFILATDLEHGRAGQYTDELRPVSGDDTDAAAVEKARLDLFFVCSFWSRCQYSCSEKQV